MKIVGVYLAAGKSSRMGSHKLALPVGSMTLGSLALETALESSLDEVYVITKVCDNADWIPVKMKENDRCKIIKCTASHEGQSESLRCGIEQARENGAEGVIVMLADQPFITLQMISGLIDCLKQNPALKFAATTVDQSITPPVLFSSSIYGDLMKLRGDRGARAILRGSFLQKGRLLPCADRTLVFDVDTKDDYETFNELKSVLIDFG
ncbi:nucleotidyltransferase family protein [Sporosarcina jeotgali]|uniref:Nucleotidyltransferase family protein n=1 Tax=Sporosarcina jeotgali TaxID=3020056 RepID=A0ABZ0KVP3_9BACL|nr:nucleotidyltransferase family protein [Sporosarcina sp. B2O-1]WOV84471.1 nucleotidyltransferase family protein [Sporosarcina sp. B2O-1]